MQSTLDKGNCKKCPLECVYCCKRFKKNYFNLDMSYTTLLYVLLIIFGGQWGICLYLCVWTRARYQSSSVRALDKKTKASFPSTPQSREEKTCDHPTHVQMYPVRGPVPQKHRKAAAAPPTPEKGGGNLMDWVPPTYRPASMEKLGRWGGWGPVPTTSIA